MKIIADGYIKNKHVYRFNDGEKEAIHMTVAVHQHKYFVKPHYDDIDVVVIERSEYDAAMYELESYRMKDTRTEPTNEEDMGVAAQGFEAATTANIDALWLKVNELAEENRTLSKRLYNTLT